MRLLFCLVLLTTCLNATGQTLTLKEEGMEEDFTDYSGRWLHTEAKYSDASGKDLIVQNGYPRGGEQFIDPSGVRYSCVVLWTRLINKTASTREFTMRFPAEPFAVFPSPESHIRLFLPSDTMRLEKDSLFNYGLDLQSYLKSGYNKPSLLQRIVAPGDESLFYVAILFHMASGSTRTALVIKGNDLFYKIKAAPELDPVLVAFGTIGARK